MKRFFTTILTIIIVSVLLCGAGFAIYRYVLPLFEEQTPPSSGTDITVPDDKNEPEPEECHHIEGKTETVVEFTPPLCMFGIDDSLTSQGLVPMPEGWDYFRGYGFTNFLTVDGVQYSFYMMFKKNNAGLDFLDESGSVIAEYSGVVDENLNVLKDIVVSFALGEVEVCGISFVSADGAHHTFNVNCTVPSGQCTLCGAAIR